MKGYKNLIQILEDWKQPVFTSANTWGTVSADNYYSSSSVNQYPWQALDGKTSGGDEADFASSSAQTVNWFWDFPTPLKITAIKMWNRNNAGNYGGATTYTIYGKNEDSSYEQIGTISLSATAWVSGETNIASNKMYYGLKIYCSGNKSNVGIGEILLTAKKLANTHRLIKHEQSNTNVITHIANDIKLEVNNNIPLLKAGSVVYIPNGFEQDGTTKKFDRVVLEADCTSASAWSATHYLFFRTSNPTVFQRSAINKTHSGDTTPTPVGSDDMWYDTANNVIKRYDGTNWNALGTCLPVGIYNGTTQQFEAIFNGFGCMGSTVFVLPDVSGLIPNGKNADGSYKVIPTTVNSVNIQTYSLSDGVRYFGINSDGEINRTGLVTNTYYIEPENLIKDTNNNTFYIAVCGTFTQTSQKITSITLQTVQPSIIPIYKAVDLN